MDVYGLQILDATLEAVDTAASALLLKHEFLDGGADNVTLATLGEVLLEPARKFSGALQQPELRGLGQLHGGRLPAGERLRLKHRAHLHADAGETLLLRLPVPAGHGLQLGDVRQRGRQQLLPRPSQGVWSTLDFLVPPGGIAKLHFGAFGGSIPGLVSSRRARWTCTACRSGPAPSRERPAGGLAGPYGLGHAGRAYRAGQRGLRPAAVQRHKLHRRVYHGRGRLGRSLLRGAHSHRHRRREAWRHAVVHRAAR